ncbi:MAG: hypothetical protein RJB61_1416 [Actinomycetota bacterium]|jgi:hypothetical protein
MTDMDVDVASVPPHGGGRLVRLNLAGTVLFGAVIAVAVPLREERPAQVVVAVASLALFAVGTVLSLWAYAVAVERSRRDEIGVANLYLLTGDTAPRSVKRTMAAALALQVVVAVTGAALGMRGLGAQQLNALAFGVLVPMLGIGTNGAWAARYGAFGPRVSEPRSARRRSAP